MPPMRTELTRRRMLAALGAGGAALLTAGCGTTGGATAAAPAAPGPHRGGTLVIGQSSDITPKSLIGQTGINVPIGRLVFNTLTEYDHKTLQPKPSLATSWQQSADGTSITVQLRQGVKYHTGRPFTSKDVIFALQQQADTKRGSQLHATAAVISDMAANGPYEVTLRLAHSVTNLFDLFEIMFLYDSETFSDLLNGARMVGTGPFVFQQWNPGDSVSLTRNPSYWRPGLPYLDAVRIRSIPQPQSLVAALRAGQVHLATNMTPTQLLAIAHDPAFTQIMSDTNSQSYYVGCNVAVPPLNNKLVRQAISYALDRESMLAEIFLGRGTASSIPWAKSNAAYRANLVDHYTYDPDRARSLLKQAGIERFATTMAINTSVSPCTPMAEIVQFNLQQVGIDVTLQPLMEVEFSTGLQNGKLPGLWVNQHGYTQLHPATTVTGAFPFNYAKNSSNFSDPAYTAEAKKSWTDSDPATVNATYDQLTSILLDEQFVIDGVISGTDLAMTNQLQGLSYNMYDYLNLDAVYLGEPA
jgi:peptide/nickel transport system substrate-binding protein